MRYPKKLEKGDTVGIICPSSPIQVKRINQCKIIIENLGYKVKMADNLAKNYAGYMAGSGKERGKWINTMFSDDEVNAIICVRGGDGGSRIMEYLDLDMIRKNPKIFVGYSDVTSLHLALNQSCDLVTFHGPMVSSNIVDDFDIETSKAFFDAINGDNEYTYISPQGFEVGVLKNGKAEGQLIGGNLAVLTAAIGTPYEPDTRNKILFIEEVGETMSRVDRMIYQLRNAGKLQNANGIILGQFTRCNNEDMPDYNELSIMRDALEGLDIPVMYNVQSGHGNPMITLPLGADCYMDTENKAIKFKVER